MVSRIERWFQFCKDQSFSSLIACYTKRLRFTSRVESAISCLLLLASCSIFNSLISRVDIDSFNCLRLVSRYQRLLTLPDDPVPSLGVIEAAGDPCTFPDGKHTTIINSKCIRRYGLKLSQSLPLSMRKVLYC